MIPAGLLFDFNGTLFFDNSLNDQAWNQLARQLRGFPFSEEEQQSFVRGKSNAAAVRRILGEDTSDTDCAKYSEQKEEIYLSLCRADSSPGQTLPGAGCGGIFRCGQSPGLSGKHRHQRPAGKRGLLLFRLRLKPVV